MAFIQDYEYDIFISYAHIDDKPFPGQAAGWIEQFYKHLSQMLDKRYGKSDVIKIWWDKKKLDGNVLFNKSIEESIKKSAIIICFYSPGYIASDYCKNELITFYKKTQEEKTGLIVGDRPRIINVLLNNIPFTEWMPELGGTTGIPFHDAREADVYGDTVDANSPLFGERMKNVRDVVWQLLNEFSKVQKTKQDLDETSKKDDKDAFTIYLGEVADTLRGTRKRVITELVKQGYNVVAGIPPPHEAEPHEKATKKALQQADLAVHLFDEIPGSEIVGESEGWYPQKQAELASQSGKSQMIWIPEETNFDNIEDEKYKHFLHNVQNLKPISKSFDFVRGSKSTLAQVITDFAEQVKIQQFSKPADEENVSVLLDTHFKDQPYAFDLGKILLENKIQPFINPQEDDPRKNINLLGDRLSLVRKLIFMYGSVSKEWVEERMNAALQLIITNNYPVYDFYIFMAPPHKEVNEISIKQRFLKINIINSSNNQLIDKVLISQFINNLKTAAL